jgi:hypothetical protein
LRKLLVVAAATAFVGGWGCGPSVSECTIGDQRCEQTATDTQTEDCVQMYGKRGDGMWIPKQICKAGEVCRVDLNGIASCVMP